MSPSAALHALLIGQTRAPGSLNSPRLHSLTGGVPAPWASDAASEPSAARQSASASSVPSLFSQPKTLWLCIDAL